MSMLDRCTSCDSLVSFESRPDAVAAGYNFVEIVVAGRVKYFVFCPTDRPAWLAAALGDEPKPEK
jgi:hypothetical protein